MGDSPHRIRVFGPFDLVSPSGEKISVKPRTTALVLAYLVGHPGTHVLRESLAEAIWPDKDPDSQRANLRNALSILRKIEGFDVLLSSDRDHVWLSSGAIDSELWVLESQLRKLNIIDGGTEFAKIADDALQTLRRPFLEEWDDDWVIGQRVYWQRKYISTLHRLAQHFEKEGDFQRALKYCEESLRHDPYQEQALAAQLRCLAHLNRSFEGLDRTRQVRRDLQREFGLDLSEGLRRLADIVRTGQLVIADPETKKDESVVVQAFERSLENGAHAAIDFIANDVSPWLLTSKPAEALDLMARALAGTDEPLHNRGVVAAACCRLALLVTRHDVVENAHKIAQECLTQGDEPLIRARTSYAFSLMERRQWSEARKILEECTALSKQQELIGAWASSQNNLAGLMWHLREYEGAVEMYEELVEETAKTGGDQHLNIMSVAFGNICFVRSTQQLWDAAIFAGRKGVEYGISANYLYMVYGTCAPLAAALSEKGELAEAVRLASNSLSGLCRMKAHRFFLVATDMVANVLANLGYAAEALHLGKIGEAHREAIGHERSPAEADFHQHVVSNCKVQKGSTGPFPDLDADMLTISAWVIGILDHEDRLDSFG